VRQRLTAKHFPDNLTFSFKKRQKFSVIAKHFLNILAKLPIYLDLNLATPLSMCTSFQLCGLTFLVLLELSVAVPVWKRKYILTDKRNPIRVSG